MADQEGPNPDRIGDAKRRLAEMEARLARYMPKPKVESGIQRGEKHSGRTLPVPYSERRAPARKRV